MVRLPAVAALAVILGIANAHFTLDYPETIGFDEDKESTGPCGGFNPDFNKNKITEFHADGDAIATTLLHPQGTWLYRGSLDLTANGNWTALFPQVLQSGVGQLCEPMITAPSSWVGKQGVVSAVVDTVDGILFQCAAVKFVSGMNMNVAACKNGTAQISFSSSSNLTPLASTGSSGGSNTTGGTTTAPSTTPTSGTKPNGAPAASVPLGNLIATAAMGLMGAALVW